MELIHGFNQIQPRHQGCVVSIGNFDGVHKGHQRLLAKTQMIAKELKAPTMLITFEPAPREFFGQSPPRLTRLREKAFWLAHYGLEHLLCLRFNDELARLPAPSFISKYLIEGLKIKALIAGDDFHFGYQRIGDFELLLEAGRRLGFDAAYIPALIHDKQRVSSNLIRETLLQGNMILAEELLGHPYSLCGRIVHGDKQGRTLGFATANIPLKRKVLPVTGVFAVRVHGIEATPLRGVANIGTRPTLGKKQALLEVHLFDFNQTIYGRMVRVDILHKLRDEHKFANIEALKNQIGKDVAIAREYFCQVVSKPASSIVS
ncbi:bifunctional riboflavin kinase/FAD synthetase [soil metagenome]